MHKTCSTLKARAKRRTKRLENESGVAASNDIEERELIKSHFARPFEGVHASFSRIIHQVRDRQAEHNKGELIPMVINAVPTLYQTMRMCASHTKQTAVFREDWDQRLTRQHLLLSRGICIHCLSSQRCGFDRL